MEIKSCFHAQRGTDFLKSIFCGNQGNLTVWLVLLLTTWRGLFYNHSFLEFLISYSSRQAHNCDHRVFHPDQILLLIRQSDDGLYCGFMEAH